MRRLIEPLIERDLTRKMVLLSGPRQAGKTTLAKAIAARHPGAQVLNWDVLADRRVIIFDSADLMERNAANALLHSLRVPG